MLADWSVARALAYAPDIEPEREACEPSAYDLIDSAVRCDFDEGGEA